MKNKFLDLKYSIMVFMNNLKFKTKKINVNTNTSPLNTLTYRLWMYFVLFATLLFIILWFMQVIFLQSYYSSMKRNEVIKIATQIEKEYINGDFKEYIDNVAYKNMSNIYIFNQNGGTIYSSNNSVNDSITTPSRPILVDINTLIDKILQSPNKKYSQTTKIDRFKSEIFLYGKSIENTDEFLLMITSIDPIDSTTSVLQSQLTYVTFISLIISTIISLFISRRLSRPIRKINEEANKLAIGNYNVEFEKAGYEEIDELADTLNYMTRELEKTDKIRRELLANVSHDLKTPLTMIKAYSEMIRDLSGDNKEKREEHLNVIIEESDRLTRLVNDMMDLSKIESGEEELKRERFNIAEITTNIVNGFKIVNDENTCKLNVECQENQFVYADKIKIEQVIYNLVNNAICHSLENKEITVKIKIIGKKIRVRIIDNGPGISKEDLQNIWKRYYKSDKTYKRANSGTGLGLSIVKNILEKHNAKYGVESEVGKGSDFWFEIERSIKKEN